MTPRESDSVSWVMRYNGVPISTASCAYPSEVDYAIQQHVVYR